MSNEFLIYKSEREAGLEDLIKSNNSIAFDSEVRVAGVKELNGEVLEKFLKRAEAKSNPNQFDLFYLDSILASVGWNNNDDVFDKVESWNARKTPVDKQFNFQHDETDIIGHITDSIVLDAKGNLIADSTKIEDLPNSFDIVVSSVLYKCWSNDERVKRMAEIIDGINKGQWFVSMECLFSNFDYAIITPDGEHKVIARNENTAFLSKHLRRYKGSGEFEGNKVGRLLKGFAFSGKGLVENPANPRSIIFSGISPFNSTKASINFNSKKEKNMTEELLKAQLDETKKKLDEAIAENKTFKAEIEKSFANKVNTLEAKVVELTTANEDLAKAKVENAKIVAKYDETIKTTKEEADAKVAAAEEKVAALNTEVNNMKAESLKASRIAKLVEVGVEAAKATEIATKFVSANDEMFAEIVELNKAAKAKTPEEKEEEEEKMAEAAKAALLAAETNGAAPLASGGETDAVANLRASATNWFKKQVLTTTANLKD